MTEDDFFVGLIWLMLAIPAAALLVAFFALVYICRGLRWLFAGLAAELEYEGAKRDISRKFDAAERRFSALR